MASAALVRMRLHRRVQGSILLAKIMELLKLNKWARVIKFVYFKF